MCGGTQLRRLSTADSDCNMMGNTRRRLSITKSCVKNFIIVDHARTRISSVDSSLVEDQESINSKVNSVQQQLNTLQKESKVAQLDFQKQIEKMHKECAERLAKITELKSRLSGLQALKKKEEETPEVVMIMPSTLKRSRPVSSISSISSSASSQKNEDFKIQRTGENSSAASSSRNRFWEHTRSVPAMFESIDVENTYGVP